MATDLELLKAISQRLEPGTTGHGFIQDLWTGVKESFGGGTADLLYLSQKLADKIVDASKSAGINVDRIKVFKELASKLEPKDLEDKVTFSHKIGRILGGLGIGIPVYGAAGALGTAVAGPAGIPIAFGALEAATSWGRDESPSEIAKKGATGVALGTLLGPVGSKLGRGVRIPAVGAGTAGIEYVASGTEAKPEDLLTTAVTFAALSAFGKHPHDLVKRAIKLGYSPAEISKMSTPELRKIVREGLGKEIKPFEVEVKTETTTKTPPPEQKDILSERRRMLDELARERGIDSETLDYISKMAMEPENKTLYDPLAKNRAIIDKIVKEKGFDPNKLDYITKLAIIGDERTAKEIKIDPSTGLIKEATKSPYMEYLMKRIEELKKTESPKAKQVAEELDNLVKKKKSNITVEDVTVFKPSEKVQKAINEVINKVEGISSIPDKTLEKLIKKAEKLGISREQAMSMEPEELIKILKEKPLSAGAVKRMISAQEKAIKAKEKEHRLKPTKLLQTLDVKEELITAGEKLGWTRDRLSILERPQLEEIISKGLTPETASITPTGRVVEIKPSDKAVAKELKLPESKVAEMKAKGEIPSPSSEKEFIEATKWAGIRPELVDTPEARDLLLDAYRRSLASQVKEAEKIGDKTLKPQAELQKAVNEALRFEPAFNTDLKKLERDYKIAKEAADAAKDVFEAGGISETEYKLALNRVNQILQQIEKVRNTLEQEAKKEPAKGKSQKIAYITENDESALVVRKKLSDTKDEFLLLSKNRMGVVPGDSDIVTSGRIVVDKSGSIPMVVEATDVTGFLNNEKLKKKFIGEVNLFYRNQDLPLASNVDNVKLPRVTKNGIILRTGVDLEVAKNTLSGLKEKIGDIYRYFASRVGINKKPPQAETDLLYKNIFDAEKSFTNLKEIEELRKEAIAHESRLRKGEAVVPLTDILGQAMANKNKDIVKLQELITIHDKYRNYLFKQLIFDPDSILNKIFEPISKKPNFEELKVEIGRYLQKKGTLTDPDALQVVKNIREFLDNFPDINDLRKKGLYVHNYFPREIDMNKTYQVIRQMFMDANTEYDLPKRFFIGDTPIFSHDNFMELKIITERKPTWDSLTTYEKNRLRYDVLQHSGIYDSLIFAPEYILEKLPKEFTNPHLLKRKTPEGIIAKSKEGKIYFYQYEDDAYLVLKSYILTTLDSAIKNQLLEHANPIIRQYGGANIPRTVRWFMERQMRQALNMPTVGQRWINLEMSRLHDKIISNLVTNPLCAESSLLRAVVEGLEKVTDPRFVSTTLPGRIATQTARGLLGVDSAIRNITQSIQSIVEFGPIDFFRSLHKYLEHISGRKPLDPKSEWFFNFLLKGEEYVGGNIPKEKLADYLGTSKSKVEKAIAFYDWLGDMAQNPMRITEHFNKFVTFIAGLEDAAKQGLSFESGIRIGLQRSGSIIPDLVIPDAIWHAYKKVIQTQYGYSKVLRNPLTRGPLAKISTIFWSYPANTIQFITRGIVDSAIQGDYAKLVRFGAYLGFQITIAEALAKLGLDVSSIFGVGLLPISPISLPWQVLKDVYLSIAGRPSEKTKAQEDLINALGAMTIPQYRYGRKVIKRIKNLFDGYIGAGSKDLRVMDTSPIHVILDLMGFPPSALKETYDMYAQLSDMKYIYDKTKREYISEGIKAIDKGDWKAVSKIIDQAKKKNIVITYPELAKYHRMHKTKTYLQSALERLPKHLRPSVEQKIKELEEEFMPKSAKRGTVGKPMWSAPTQLGRIIVESEGEFEIEEEEKE